MLVLEVTHQLALKRNSNCGCDFQYCVSNDYQVDSFKY